MPWRRTTSAISNPQAWRLLTRWPKRDTSKRLEIEDRTTTAERDGSITAYHCSQLIYYFFSGASCCGRLRGDEPGYGKATAESNAYAGGSSNPPAKTRL